VERPTGLVVPAAGDVRAVAPSMFAEPLAPYAPLLWTDDDGPEAAIAAGLRGIRRLLVGGALPAAHLFLLRDAVGDVALDPGIVAGLRRRKTPAETYTITESLEIEPKLKAKYETEPQTRELLVQAQKLEGLTRHAGKHAAGIVISEGPLWDHVPCFKSDPPNLNGPQAAVGAPAAPLMPFPGP